MKPEITKTAIILTALAGLLVAPATRAAPPLDLSRYADDTFILMVMDVDSGKMIMQPGNDALLLDGSPAPGRAASRAAAHEAMEGLGDLGAKTAGGGFYVRRGWFGRAKPALSNRAGGLGSINSAYMSRGNNTWRNVSEKGLPYPVGDLAEETRWGFMSDKYRHRYHQALADEFNTTIHAPDLDVEDMWGRNVRQDLLERGDWGVPYQRTYRPRLSARWRHFKSAVGRIGSRSWMRLRGAVPGMIRFGVCVGVSMAVGMGVDYAVTSWTGNRHAGFAAGYVSGAGVDILVAAALGSKMQIGAGAAAHGAFRASVWALPVVILMHAGAVTMDYLAEPVAMGDPQAIELQLYFLGNDDGIVNDLCAVFSFYRLWYGVTHYWNNPGDILRIPVTFWDLVTNP
jgi:hypothetical protein